MEMQLELVNKEISIEENTYLDDLVSQVIEKHKSNYGEINRLVMDSVTCLATSEARAKGLRDQGPLRRFWNNLTGKNQKLQASINLDLASAQRASQKMIQKLAEQNLITFDTVVAVNNKLNSHMIEVDKEIEEIYKTLITFFKQTQSNLIQLGTRLDKVERNVDLLHWHETIEYRMLNGIEYQELPQIEKLICITNDFYHATGKTWSTKDLMLLKSTFDDIALPVKSEISLQDFFGYTIENPHITEKLFEGIPTEGLAYIEPYEAATVKGIEKIQILSNDEQYVVSTIEKQLTGNGVDTSDKDIKVDLVDKYVENMAFRSTERKMTVFDLSLELLSSLKMTEEEYNRVLEEQNAESESEILLHENHNTLKNEFKEIKENYSKIQNKNIELIEGFRQLIYVENKELARLYNASGANKVLYWMRVDNGDDIKQNGIVVSIRISNLKDKIYHSETGSEFTKKHILFLSKNDGKILLLEKPEYGIFGIIYHPDDDIDNVKKCLENKVLSVKEFLEKQKALDDGLVVYNFQEDTDESIERDMKPLLVSEKNEWGVNGLEYCEFIGSKRYFF